MKDQSINMKEINYEAYYLQGKQERLAFLQDAAAVCVIGQGKIQSRTTGMDGRRQPS
jgi:hypothetical protein